MNCTSWKQGNISPYAGRFLFLLSVNAALHDTRKALQLIKNYLKVKNLTLEKTLTLKSICREEIMYQVSVFLTCTLFLQFQVKNTKKKRSSDISQKKRFWEFHVIAINNSKKRCFNFDFYFYVCIQAGCSRCGENSSPLSGSISCCLSSTVSGALLVRAAAALGP